MKRNPYRLFPDDDEMAAMDRELDFVMFWFVAIALGFGIPLGLLFSWLSR